MHHVRQQDLPHVGSSHQLVRESRGLWTVNGVEFDGRAGDIFVIKAGEIHGFKAIGDANLVQVDVHMSPTFIQENL